MESLLSLLMEAEAQMNEGMAGMDKRERAEKDSSGDQLTQQLSLCKASAFKPQQKALYIVALLPLQYSMVLCHEIILFLLFTSILYFFSVGSPDCSDGSIQ